MNREEAIKWLKAIEKKYIHGGDEEYDNLRKIALHMAMESLEQPERKTGRWIVWNYPGEECAICSACGEEYDQMDLYIGGNDYPNFCPNCGAYMRKEEMSK